MTISSVSEKVDPVQSEMHSDLPSSQKKQTSRKGMRKRPMLCFNLMSDATYDTLVVLSLIFLVMTNIIFHVDHYVGELRIIESDFVSDLACQLSFFAVAWIWKKNNVSVSVVAFISMWVFSLIFMDFRKSLFGDSGDDD